MTNEEKNKRWAALMKKAHLGDGESYRILLEEILIPIRAFCHQRVGYLGVTEDVVQEGLLAIHKVRHTFDVTRSFTAWMYAIVRYTMIDFLRSRKTHTGKDMIPLEDFENVLSTDTAEKDALSEAKGTLHLAVEKLDPIYKEAIQLTKVEGLSVLEASQKLGVSESVLKVRTHRAVQQLKKILARALND